MITRRSRSRHLRQRPGRRGFPTGRRPVRSLVPGRGPAGSPLPSVGPRDARCAGRGTSARYPPRRWTAHRSRTRGRS